jgi:hypothetical protein
MISAQQRIVYSSEQILCYEFTDPEGSNLQTKNKSSTNHNPEGIEFLKNRY